MLKWSCLSEEKISTAEEKDASVSCGDKDTPSISEETSAAEKNRTT